MKIQKLRRVSTKLLLLVAAVALAACARTVTVTIPPKVDLHAYPTIGIIGFVSPSSDVGPAATQKFLGNLQAAQPGVRLLELGSREEVLREIGGRELDHRAVRAIGGKYGVAAVVAGTAELSEIRPDFSIGRDLRAVSAQAKIDGKMSARLWETASGALVWTNDSWGSWPVAGATLREGGRTTVGYRHPQEKRDQIVLELVRALNGSFWPTYQKRKVKD